MKDENDNVRAGEGGGVSSFKAKIQSMEFFKHGSSMASHFDDPSEGVDMLKEPTLERYHACRRKLESADHEWIEAFLHADGLEVREIIN